MWLLIPDLFYKQLVEIIQLSDLFYIEFTDLLIGLMIWGLENLKFSCKHWLIGNIVDFLHSENEQRGDPFLKKLVEMFALAVVDILPLAFTPDIII